MHDAARTWLEAVAGTLRRPRRVCEVGSRNVNGSVRYLFPRAAYAGVDLLPGPNVDVVADGATWHPGYEFDVVLCAEVLEHCPHPAELVANLARLCRPGGAVLITAAAPGREPHSGIDGGPLKENEYYRAVTADDLRAWLPDCRAVAADGRTPGDVYCLAVR